MKQTMGQRLAALREARGENQIDVAEASGLGRTYISMLEKDKKHGSIASLAALADYYGVTLDYLYKGGSVSAYPDNVAHNEEERVLLHLWRTVGEEERRSLMVLLRAQIIAKNAA